MPEITFTVILFNSFPEVILTAYLGLSLLGLRTGWRPILLIGCWQVLFDIFLFLIVGKIVAIPFGIHTIIQTVAFSVVIYGVTRISYESSLLAVLLGVGGYLCIDTLVTPAFIFVMGYSSTMDLNNWWVRMAYFSFLIIVTTMVIFVIHRFNFRLIDGPEAVGSNRLLWVAGMLFTQSLLSTFAYWTYFLPYKQLFSPAYFYAYIIINIMFPTVTIVIIRQFAALIKSEVESRAQLDSLRHVEELLQTMRTQRHNFSHELQVVYGLLAVGAFQEAKEYLQKSVAEVAAAAELVKTDNLGVTALLYTKAGLAEARKMALQITVETSLRQLPVEVRDINLILGNLIDNALDAVETLPVPERMVEVVIAQGLEGYEFTVKNGGPPVPELAIAQIFTPGFSTKGEGRGMGLYSVQKLVAKYHGDTQVTSDSNGTLFRVVIPTA